MTAHRRYTQHQLRCLKDSRLAAKPDNLPDILQWIDPPVDQTQRKARGQGSAANNRNEENEPPSKRPQPFEGRQTSRHTNPGNQSTVESDKAHTNRKGRGDDIFLGPKLSFASASAARQTGRSVANEEKLNEDSEDLKDRSDRFSGRDRSLRDRDGRERENDRYRGRFGHRNEDHESSGSTDFRHKRGLENHGKNRDHNDSGFKHHSAAPARGRLDQPWFRDEKKKHVTEGDATHLERDTRKDWRVQNVRDNNGQQDYNPQWMKDTNESMDIGHTQEDFQKWKDKMKAGNSKADVPLEAEEGFLETVTQGKEDTNSSVENKAPTLTEEMKSDLWGASKADVSKTGNEPKTPKVLGTKNKQSRFAGFFAPQNEPQPPEEQKKEDAPSQSPANQTSEDREGFQRMMEMLRMGGSSSREPAAETFNRPATDQFGPELGSHHEPQSRNIKGSFDAGQPRQGSLRSPELPQMHSTHSSVHPASQEQYVDSGSRDSQFLMNLMKQQQASFAESNIYGHDYNRKNSGDLSTILNIFGPKTADPAPYPPHTGFLNDRAFTNNQHMDFPPHHARGPSQPRNEERFPLSPYEGQRFQQFSQYEQSGLRTNNYRQSQDNVVPPPGFSSNRSQAPPGFFHFPSNGGGNNALPSQHISPGIPPPMRNSMPQPPPQHPPGFYNGPGPPQSSQRPPPGFFPQQIGNTQARVQQMGEPPGYDVMDEAYRRGMPPPTAHSTQQQQQYMKYDGNGRGVYGEM